MNRKLVIADQPEVYPQLPPLLLVNDVFERFDESKVDRVIKKPIDPAPL